MAGTLTQKVRSAYRLLRDEGVTRFGSALRSRASVKLGIYLRGRNKTVFLDGCRFELRGLPDTRMKLELLTGRYEQPERNAVRAYLPPDLPVVELGGCVGVVSCITNKVLKSPARHVVLEANPLAIPHLTRNREVNGCDFKILNRALAYDCRTVTFRPSPDLWGTSLDHNLSMEVPVITPSAQLSQILSEEGFDRYVLICDIEGYEYELVMREPEALRQAELVIMELHPHMIGEDKVRVILSEIQNLGFMTLDHSALVIVLSK